VKTAKKVENGNVLQHSRDMKMNVNVLHGVLMDGIWRLVQEIKVFGFGRVTTSSLVSADAGGV
jgi:hypothetical protein